MRRVLGVAAAACLLSVAGCGASNQGAEPASLEGQAFLPLVSECLRSSKVFDLVDSRKAEKIPDKIKELGGIEGNAKTSPTVMVGLHKPDLIFGSIVLEPLPVDVKLGLQLSPDWEVARRAEGSDRIWFHYDDSMPDEAAAAIERCSSPEGNTAS